MTSKEFGSSQAYSVFGAYERGRHGGLAPEWIPYAIGGGVLLLFLWLIARH